MNVTKKVWRPAGVPQNLEEALSVPAPPNGQMSLDLYKDLLAAKFEHLIRANPADAASAMQMSSEAAPGLYTIASAYPSREWPRAIVNADGMTQLLRKLRLDDGSLMDPPDPPQSFRAILEVLPVG